ncbi:MAG: GNAT family N-acetyltransferase [Stigonema ocellatum SAG 48.90 = DSM 106950]|nr:GNAT family N-acetyltransferase [Stigonema ocellatum SAG 48.90 = DSM 106950]
MEPSIRRVNVSDVPPLHNIWLTCGRDLKNRFGLSHWMPPTYPLEQMLKDAMEQEVYALTVGENLVGTFTLEMTATVPLSYIKYGNILWQIWDVPAVYVHKLAILPDWQGLGLGTWCMGAIEKLAAHGGYHAVRLDGVKTHPKLLSFYKTRGYQEVGELIYNSDVWVDAIVFEKVLIDNPSLR